MFFFFLKLTTEDTSSWCLFGFFISFFEQLKDLQYKTQ